MESALTAVGYRSEAFFTTGEFIARAFNKALRARDGQDAPQQSLALVSAGTAAKNFEPFSYSNIEVKYILPTFVPNPSPPQPATTATESEIITLRTVYQYKCLAKSSIAKPENVTQQAWDFALAVGGDTSDWNQDEAQSPSAATNTICERAVDLSPCRFPVDSENCSKLSEPLRQAFAARAQAAINDYKSPSYYWSVRAPNQATDTGDSEATERAKQYAEKISTLTPALSWSLSYDGIYAFKGKTLAEFAITQDLGQASENEAEAMIGTVGILAVDQLDMAQARAWLTAARNRKDVSMSNLAIIEKYLDYFLR
jgi:hypothetical protein